MKLKYKFSIPKIKGKKQTAVNDHPKQPEKAKKAKEPKGGKKLFRVKKKQPVSAEQATVKTTGPKPPNKQTKWSPKGAWRYIRTSVLVNPFKSVGIKLFAIFFICILSFVLVLGLIAASQAKGIIEEKVAHSSSQTIRLAADKIELMLKNYEDITYQMLTDNTFMKQLMDYKLSPAGSYEKFNLERDIRNKMMAYASRQGITAMTMLDLETGKGPTTSSTFQTQDNVTEQDWFKRVVEANGSVVWLDSQLKGYLGGSNEPMFAYARLLKDSVNNRQDFVVIVEIKSSQLNAQLAGIYLSEGYPVYVMNDQGILMSADNNAKVGTPFDVAISPDELNASAKEARYLSEGGKLTVFKKMNTSGWTVVTTAPVTQLVLETERIEQTTWIIIGAATVIALAAGFLVARMIGTPLNRLRTLMEQGARGILTVRSSIRRKDEIGQLADSFNVMMEQIAQLVRQTSESAAQVMKSSSDLLEASKQTSLSAKEIAVATEEIANGASSLAMEAEKGNAITQEVSEQMKDVILANQDMERAAQEVEAVSERGTAYMEELIDKTNRVEWLTRNMVEKFDQLKESTSSIRKILEVLTSISKQTNILSLNATIEAARAGAAGKGFMVVADEIRKLAEQSKDSIDVVGQITDKIQEEMDETVKALSEAYPMFQEQISSVKEANLIFTQVKAQMGSLSERLAGVTESVERLRESQVTLTEAISNVSAVSEESSATSQEVASLSNEQLNVSQNLVSLAENLEKLSNNLNEILSKFKVE